MLQHPPVEPVIVDDDDDDTVFPDILVSDDAHVNAYHMHPQHNMDQGPHAACSSFLL